GFGVTSADGRQRFGLRLRKAREFGLRGMTLMGIGSSAGIEVDGTGNGGGCWIASVDQVTVTRTPGTGLRLRGEVNALTFRGCDFAAAGEDNVLVQGGKAIAFNGCVFEGAVRGAEVRVAPVDGATVAALSLAQSWLESRASGSAGRGLLIDEAPAGGVRSVALRDSFLGGNGGADVMIECRAASGELTLAGNAVVGVKRGGVLRRQEGFRILGGEGEAYRYSTGSGGLPMLLPGT
ncbi:MAG TPA: right-handed parallel beta-helix repeat-containing protein, partial [Gemmatimonadales bacterium]